MNLHSLLERLRITCITGVLVGCMTANATGQTFRSVTYTELDGLPSSLVYDVAIAPDQTAWFATRTGVASFDGVRWSLHGANEGFPDSIGPAHVEFDKDGQLWVAGTDLGQGLARFDGNAWRHVPTSTAFTPEETVSALEFAPGPTRERLHALLTTGRLVRLLGNEWVTVTTGVNGLHAFPDGMLLATERGLERLNRQGAIRPLPNSPIRPFLAVHRGIGPDGNEQIWALEPNALGLLSRDGYELLAVTQPLFHTVSEGPNFLQLDGLGRLYIGHWRGVLLWSDGEMRSLQSLAEGSTGMARDQHHNIWITTGRGVTRIPPLAWEYFDSRSGLLEDETTALLPLADGAIIAGHNGGITRIANAEQPERSFEPLLPTSHRVGRVLDLEADDQGGFWIAAASSGAARVDRNGKIHWLGEDGLLALAGSADHTHVASIIHDPQGTLWMGGNWGVSKDQGQGLEPVPLPDSNLHVRKLLLNPAGEIVLCSSDKGVFQRRNGQWLQSLGQEQEHNSVFNVGFPAEGPPLVGTMGGLRILSGDQLLAPPPELKIDVPVYTINEDSRGWLWFGTEHGVYRWNGHKLRHFTVADGLAGQEINRDAVMEDSQHRMWFGTNRGLSRYDPSREIHHEAPPLRSVQATSRGEILPLADAPQIMEGGNLYFDLDIASLAGIGAPELRFRTLGTNEPWSAPLAAENCQLRFTNLPVGPLRVEVQTRNAAGSWSASIPLPTVRVRPPFTGTWWFYTLALTLGAVLVASMTGLVFRSHQARQLRSELAQRTTELRATELQFERFFALNPAGQLLVDPASGAIQQANASAEGLLGPELTGNSLSACLTRAKLAVDPQELFAALVSTAGETRLYLNGSDPESLNLELRIARFGLGKGELALVTATDITITHRLEEQLRRTQSLRAIGELAGGLAHDFNNLLTTILGHAELLCINSQGNKKLEDRAGGIRNAAKRGADLVRKLLAFGRRQVLQPEVIALSPVVNEVIAPLGDLLGARIQIEAELRPNAGHVLADRAEIDRAVLNLCLNAREAMPGGGTLRITVRPARIEELASLNLSPGTPGEWILLAVKDDGVGMSAEVRSRLFEPFFTTKENTDGAGLGLSTVHGIVTQSGGHLEVHSAPGQGTEMRIFLPAVPAKLPASPPIAPPANPSAGREILLVEDRADVRGTISALLVGLGYRVQEAEDGLQALHLWQADPDRFDLVLTDVMMPRMGGVELGRELERLAPGQSVLYMSGYLDQAAKLATDSVLTKPFSLEELQSAVERMLPVEDSPPRNSRV